MRLETTPIVFIRRLLLAILVIGLIGTEIELLLLKHTDGFWQLAPVVMLGAGIVVTGWFGISPTRAPLLTLRALMAVFLVTGCLGVIQHFLGNIEYARESNPSLGGSDLYAEAVMGSTPTLAPGTMIQLALVGLAFAFRHPSLGASRDEREPLSPEAPQ